MCYFVIRELYQIFLFLMGFSVPIIPAEHLFVSPWVANTSTDVNNNLTSAGQSLLIR